MPYKDEVKQKSAQQSHYRKNIERYREQSRAAKAQKQEEINRIKSVPCMDCGIQYPPFVMDFDHRDPTMKTNGVSRLQRSAGWSKVLEEINKCDIVCANCHRIRTHSDLI